MVIYVCPCVGHRKICELPVSHLRAHLRSLASHLWAACVSCKYLRVVCAICKFATQEYSKCILQSLIPLSAMLFRPGGSKQEGNNKLNCPLAWLKIYKEIGSSSLINFLIRISEDTADDWGSHQQKELEFTYAYNSIRRDMSAEILVSKLWSLTLTCAIKQFLINQPLACNMQVRYLALHNTTPINVTLMSWQSGDLGDPVTCDFVNDKLGSSIKSSMWELYWYRYIYK